MLNLRNEDTVSAGGGGIRGKHTRAFGGFGILEVRLKVCPHREAPSCHRAILAVWQGIFLALVHSCQPKGCHRVKFEQ